LRGRVVSAVGRTHRGWLELAELDEAVAAGGASPDPEAAVDLDVPFAVLGEMVRDWLRQGTSRS
jgi:hypothetical protein